MARRQPWALALRGVLVLVALVCLARPSVVSAVECTGLAVETEEEGTCNCVANAINPPNCVCKTDYYQSNATTCSPVSTCTTSEYETAAPTPTTNRMCDDLTACTGSQYESTPPTATTNRMCAAIDDCGGTEYQTAAPTATTNRMCDDLTVCTGSQYESTPPTATTNRMCAAIDDCTDTEYETAAPTATTNRMCDDLTVCTGSQYESTPATATTNRMCTAIDDCTDTEYQTAAPTATTNRMCDDITECALGDFETAAPTPTSNRECATLRSCETFEYESTPATETTDRVCANLTICDEGSYASITATPTSDRQCELCPAGTTDIDGDGTATSGNGNCETCPAGTSVPAGSSGMCATFLCAPGSIDADNNPANACVDCNGVTEFQNDSGQTMCKTVTTCPPGETEVMNGGPTRSADRQCEECTLSINFKPMPGQQACTATKQCPPGETEDVAATLTSDRTCVECGMNTFKSTEGQDDCAAVTICQPGFKEKFAPTTSTDRECEACPSGQFQDTAGRTKCEVWTVCGDNEYEAAEPTSSSDRQCNPITTCVEGQWQSVAPTSTSDATCQPCTPCAGVVTQACTATSNTVCEDCSTCMPGTQFVITECTADRDISCGTCKQCNSTEYETSPCRLSINGDRQCHPLSICGADEYESARSTKTSNRVCTDLNVCDSTEFISTAATPTTDRQCTTYKSCSAGQYIHVAGTPTSDRDCAACPAGKSDADANPNTMCQPCPQGSYSEEGHIGACTVCTPGFYDDDKSATTPCVSCPDEHFQSMAGAVQCLPHTVCREGEGTYEAPTSISDRICRTCLPGTHKVASGDGPCIMNTECDAMTEYMTAAPTISSDRSCAEITECTSTQYEVTPPTATSNRVCSAITVCSDSQFQTAAPTATSDRSCAPITECATNMYQSAMPTATTDAECEDYTRCQVGHFISVSATPTSDLECSVWTECMPGEYQTAVPTTTSDRECDSYTSCRSSEFEAIKPTPTSDRECEDISSCTSGMTYETAAATATTDRVCMAVSQCQTDQYVLAEATLTSDTVCKDHSVCVAGQYESQAPTTTSDRECTVWTVCESDEYQTRSPTEFRDRRCRSLTVCGMDEYESLAPTSTSDRECTGCATTCDEDHYISVGCTATTDVQCSQCDACAEGVSYETRACTPTTNRRCSACASCSGGSFVSEACTVTSNTVCSMCNACPPNEYEKAPCEEGHDTLCEACTVCGAGVSYRSGGCVDDKNTVCTVCTECTNQFVSRVCSPFLDTGCNNCTVCDIGTYTAEPCGFNDTVCANCEDGKYQNRRGQDACLTCRSCPPGQFIETPCSRTANTVCGTCDGENFYHDGTDAEACKKCTTCEAGTYVSAPCTPTSDRECSRCPSGTYQLEENIGSCNNCTVCGTGLYQIAACVPTADTRCTECRESCAQGEFVSRECGGTDDLDCDRCEQDTFQNIDGFTGDACTACTDCDAGDFVTRECTDEVNRLCGPCSAGTYSTEANSLECSICNVGHYQNEIGQTDCKACGLGKFSNVIQATDSSSCRDCAQGTYADEEGLQQCKHCPTGKFGQGRGGTAASVCSGCGLGKYQDETGQGMCKACGAGTYSDQQGRTACKECPAGTHSDTVSATSDETCVDCQAGFYQPLTGQSACVACGLGKFSDAEGAILEETCSKCAPGAYQDQLGRTECKLCPPGTMSTATGAVSMDTCVPCPIGYYQPESGQTQCIPCSPGSSADSPGQSSCDACGENFYQPAEAQRSCLACQECLMGFTEAGGCNGTHTSNRICVDLDPPTINITRPIAPFTAVQDNYVVEAHHVDLFQPLLVRAFDAAERRVLTPTVVYRDGSGNPLAGPSQVIITAPATYTVTYSATDNSGNTRTRVVAINVVDTTRPVISIDPLSVVIEAAVEDVAFTAGVSVFDRVDGNALMSCLQHDGTQRVNVFVPGTYTVTYSLDCTDSSGRVALEKTREYIVRDRTPPVITLNGDDFMIHQAGRPFVDPLFSAIDTLDGDLTDAVEVVNPVPVMLLDNRNRTFTITYDVSDAAGNVAMRKTRRVLLIDTLPPVITLHGSPSLFVEATSSYSDMGASAVDRNLGDDSFVQPRLQIFVDGQRATFTSTPTSVPTVYTFVYTSTDRIGNSVSVTRTVTVRDTTPPVVALIDPSNTRFEAGVDQVSDVPGITAVDAYFSESDITITSNVETVFLTRPPAVPHNARVIYTATDGAGNSISITRDIVIEDTRVPRITVLQPAVSVQHEGGVEFTDLRTGFTAFDDFLQVVTNRVQTSVTTLSLGVPPQPETCTSLSSSSFANRPPVYTPHNANPNGNFIDVFAPADTVYRINLIVTDSAGHTGVNQRTVTIVDTTDPVLNLLGEQNMYIEFVPSSLRTDPAYAALAFSDPGVEATDTLDGDITSFVCVDVKEYEPISSFNTPTPSFTPNANRKESVPASSVRSDVDLGTLYRLEYRVRDRAGRRASPVFRNVVVRDSTPPTLTLEVGTEITIPYGTEFREPGYSARDTHAGDLTASVERDGDQHIDVFVPSRYSVYYSVSDAVGNRVTLTRVFEVTPNTRPLDTMVVVMRFNGRAADVIPDRQAFASDLSQYFGGSFVIVFTVRQEGLARRRSLQASPYVLVEVGVRDHETLDWWESAQVLAVLETAPASNGLVALSSANGSAGPDAGLIIGVLAGVILILVLIVVVVRRRDSLTRLSINRNIFKRSDKVSAPKNMNDPRMMHSHERQSIGMTIQNPIFEARRRAQQGQNGNVNAPDNGMYALQKGKNGQMSSDYLLDSQRSANGQQSLYTAQGEPFSSFANAQMNSTYDAPKITITNNNSYDSPAITENYDRPQVFGNMTTESSSDEAYDLPFGSSHNTADVPPPVLPKKGSGMPSTSPHHQQQGWTDNQFDRSYIPPQPILPADDAMANLMLGTQVDQDEDDDYSLDLVGHAVTMPEFCGQISRSETEKKLKNLPAGTYLLRASKATTGGVVLSVVSPKKRFEHHILDINGAGKITVNKTALPNCVSLQQAISLLMAPNDALPYELTGRYNSPRLTGNTSAAPKPTDVDDTPPPPIVGRKPTVMEPSEAMPSGMSKTSTLTAADRTTWMHGEISRQEAESRLREGGMADGLFLVRTKPTAKGLTYAVSMAYQGRFSHHLVVPGADGLWTVNSKPTATPCHSLDEVIELLRTAPPKTVPCALSSSLSPTTEA